MHSMCRQAKYGKKYAAPTRNFGMPRSLNKSAAWSTDELVSFICTEFAALADETKAAPMAAYMKTDMPFYGIQKPERIPVYKAMKQKFPAQSQTQYESAIKALWKLPRREEKYAALEFAKQNKGFITVKSYPLYRSLIVSGAWWDLVDDIATNLISDSYMVERAAINPIIEEWIDDKDMWIRRTAILAHNHHKSKTDWQQLSDHCLRRAHEKEFFIRKAIGWALREYSYANPQAVKAFLQKNKAQLAPLSFKEGAKQLLRAGDMKV